MSSFRDDQPTPKSPEGNLANEPGRYGVRAWVVALGVGIVLVPTSIAVLLIMPRSHSSTEARSALVEGDGVGEEGRRPTSTTAAMTSVTTPDGSPAQAADADETAAPAAPAPPDDTGAAFRGELSRHQRRIERCVESYERSGTHVPELSMELSINAEGLVEQITLHPTELVESPLSVCLEAVARMMRFGPQSSEEQVRVPIRPLRID